MVCKLILCAVPLNEMPKHFLWIIFLKVKKIEFYIWSGLRFPFKEKIWNIIATLVLIENIKKLSINALVAIVFFWWFIKGPLQKNNKFDNTVGQKQNVNSLLNSSTKEQIL